VRFAKLVLAGSLFLPAVARAQDVAPPTSQTKPRISLADFEDAFLEVAEQVRPGVVAIEVRHDGEDERDFARNVNFSGVVWDADGTIVAIGKDLESANEILVSPFEGDAVKAKFVGVDDETGIAVLKLEGKAPKGLRVLEHGAADSLRAGSFCVAVGNPVGLRHSVAFGHVAATGRKVRRGAFLTSNAIQVTLPVNPGDPGGLLADSRGKIVGILSSSLRRDAGSSMGLDKELGDVFKRLFQPGQREGSGGPPPGEFERTAARLRRAFEPGLGQAFTQNVSFAIPVGEVARAVERVKATRGKPWLGVDVLPLDDDERKELGVDGKRGVIVIGVRDGSPAFKATIKARDVVLSWNGDAVKGTVHLRELVLGTAPGAVVQIEILRGTDKKTLPVTIEGRSGSSENPKHETPK
jgi:serine protease Do